MQPSHELTTSTLAIVEWIRFLLEAAGAATIAAGGIAAIVKLARTIAANGHPHFTAARLELSRYLTLALEFQLAADILETATSEQWTKIGQLAAIGAIRTALNYSLAREMKEERDDLGTTRE